MRFWDASGVSLKPLYKLGTAGIFQTDCEHNDSLNQAGEEEWPPFRKVTSRGDTGGGMLWSPAPPCFRGSCPRRIHPSCAVGTCPLARGTAAASGTQGTLVLHAPSRGALWGGGSQGTGDAWGRS